jgi:hypothetical protein
LPRAERRAARRWRASTTWEVLKKEHQAELVGRRLFGVGGEGDLAVATTYRLWADGRWQAATRVYEVSSGESYWLPGDPGEEPQLEGFLEGRLALPHLSQATH